MIKTKTREELDNLKAQWLADPCWDIEATPGFEAHWTELWRFNVEMQAKWASEERLRIETKADNWGCSVTMAYYVERLEERIKRLEEFNDDR